MAQQRVVADARAQVILVVVLVQALPIARHVPLPQAAIDHLRHQLAARQRVLDPLPRDRVGQVGRVADPQHLARRHPRALLGPRQVTTPRPILHHRRGGQRLRPRVAGDEQLQQPADVLPRRVVVAQPHPHPHVEAGHPPGHRHREDPPVPRPEVALEVDLQKAPLRRSQRRRRHVPVGPHGDRVRLTPVDPARVDDPVEARQPPEVLHMCLQRLTSGAHRLAVQQVVQHHPRHAIAAKQVPGRVRRPIRRPQDQPAETRPLLAQRLQLRRIKPHRRERLLGPERHRIAASLVAREQRAIDEHDLMAAARQVVPRRATARSSSDNGNSCHGDSPALHSTISRARGKCLRHPDRAQHRGSPLRMSPAETSTAASHEDRRRRGRIAQ